MDKCNGCKYQEADATIPVKEVQKVIDKLEKFKVEAMERWKSDEFEIIQHGKAIAYNLSIKLLTDLISQEDKQ